MTEGGAYESIDTERFTSVFDVEDLEDGPIGLLILLVSSMLFSWPLDLIPVMSCLSRDTGID